MSNIHADDLEIKQTLVGLHRYQLRQLAEAITVIHRPRSEIIRDAVDLWLRGFKLKQDEEVSNDG